MFLTNVTNIKDFFILGFPGLASELYGPVSALLFLIYLLIAVGNLSILVVVQCEPSLHKPTYLIFCHLALSDLAFGTVTLPKILWKYWFNDGTISFSGCFVQMYLVHSLGAAHSFVLMVMALDRLVAVCAPLRYAALLTNTTVSVLCGMSWFLPMSCMVGIVLDALTLPFCGSNIIVQCYCDHISLTVLGCGNVQAVWAGAFGLAMCTMLLPLLFIIFSYSAVIVVAARISGSDGRSRTFSTCAPQLLITCLYFLPKCFVYMANISGFTFSPPVRVVVIMVYSLSPAVVNPLIYCFKTKDIKENLRKKFFIGKMNVCAAAKLAQGKLDLLICFICCFNCVTLL